MAIANVLATLVMFPLVHIVVSVTLYCAGMWYLPYLRLPLLGYAVFCYFDRSPSRGGYKWAWDGGYVSYLRGLYLWKLASGYFPMQLHKTAELEPGKPYLFCNHPHGVIGSSVMAHFGTNGTGFEQMFPGITVHLAGLKPIFRIPIFREWVNMHGHCTPGKTTLESLLGEKRSVVLAVGGAKEAFFSDTENTMRLIIRSGFVRVAMAVPECSLVPCIAFGENQLYTVYSPPKGSLVEKVQFSLQKLVGFSTPIFCGAWWCPLLPKQLPVDTVVGAPVSVPYNTQPSSELVQDTRDKYVAALTLLFETHKARFGPRFATMKLVVMDK